MLNLGEIAEINIRPAQRRGVCIHNGKESIVLTIRKQANARIFSLRKSFTLLLADFHKEYPQLEFELTNDQSNILDISVNNLETSLQWGALFAVLILCTFFKEWRTPLLIAIVIPISLVIALFGFFLLNISINIISLTGLVLGVGLMVDNSIIIIENIRQHLRMGSPHEVACIEGPVEVVQPLISSALTTCSVFVPLIYLSGLAGVLFYDQALSVTLALGASLITAYILLPTIIRLNKKWKPADIAAKNQYPLYNKMVNYFINQPWINLGIATLITTAFLISYKSLKIESFPTITREGIMLTVDWNEPIGIEENKRRFDFILSDLKEIVHSSDIFIGEQQFLLTESNIAGNQAQAWIYGEEVNLKSRLTLLFSEKYPNASVEIGPIKTIFDELFGGRQSPLVAHVQNISSHETPDLERLKPILDWLSSQNIGFSIPTQKQDLTLKILREKALLYDIPFESIVDRLKAIFEEYALGSINDSQMEIPMIYSWGSGQPELDRIESATITNREGLQLPLRQFIQIGRRTVPRQFTSTSSGESFDIRMSSWPGDNFIEGLRNKVLESEQLVVHFSGQHFKDQQQVKELSGIALISFVLLYLILAAQFESLLLPIIVIITVPIGVAGALLALELTGQTLNLVSLTGMVVMGGIVVNDAILKLDMMQRLNRQMPLREAIHQAGARRLRPIIMTSATTILALIPILFTGGIGAELQHPLSLAIIGGLTFGTMASLFLVPSLFLIYEKHLRHNLT